MKTLRLYGAGLLVALLLTLTACVPSTSGVYYPNFTVTLSLDSTSLTVPQGSSGTTRVTITVLNRSTGTLSVYLEGAPSGVRSSFTAVKAPSEIFQFEARGTLLEWILKLTISVDSGVAPGIYNLRVKATFSGVTETEALWLVVTPRGPTWTLRSSGGTDLSGVAYGNGLFVAVGAKGTILTSPDGVSWTKRTSGGNTLVRVVHGNGLFVAVGAKGTILTSPDGVNWTARASGTDKSLFSVAYGNGLFVAVGIDGTILTSRDGVNWTRRTLGGDGFNGFLDVTYGNGTFVAVGAHGVILTSPDGVTWTPQNSRTGKWLLGVTYGNGTFVAVGIGDAILTFP
jgi:hypothetical protein